MVGRIKNIRKKWMVGRIKIFEKNRWMVGWIDRKNI